jgi:hypothetical protein
MNLNSYVQSKLFQILSCLLQNLVLKATYLHNYVVMEQIVVLMVDPGQNPIYVPLLIVELEILASSWAIFYTPTLLTFAPTWEKLVVLDQI